MDPKIVDEFYNNEPSVGIEGGDSRPSKLVNLQKFESIRRRQALNMILLRRICGGESIEDYQPFDGQDRDILIQIAKERDNIGNVAIRKHAISALGQYKDLKVAESLLGISLSNIEDEIIKSHALISLAKVSPKVIKPTLPHHIKDKSSLIRQTIVNIIGEIGDELEIDLLDKLLRNEQNRAVLHRSSIAIQSLEERIGVRIDSKIKRRLKPVLRPSKPRKPRSEIKVHNK